MTLPDLEEHEEEQEILSQSVVAALIKVIQQAVQQGRLTCGVQDCIKLLGSCPEKIMLCLLAQNSSGPSQDACLKIQHVLIRAFCQENGIDLLHVEDHVKLTQLILTSLGQLSLTSQVAKPSLEENSMGYSCVMIQYSGHKDASHDEDAVSEYVNKQLHANVVPYVTLPA